MLFCFIKSCTKTYFIFAFCDATKTGHIYQTYFRMEMVFYFDMSYIWLQFCEEKKIVVSVYFDNVFFGITLYKICKMQVHILSKVILLFLIQSVVLAFSLLHWYTIVAWLFGHILGKIKNCHTLEINDRFLQLFHVSTAILV